MMINKIKIKNKKMVRVRPFQSWARFSQIRTQSEISRSREKREWERDATTMATRESIVVFTVLLMLILILLFIFIACKPWRFFFPSYRSRSIIKVSIDSISFIYFLIWFWFFFFLNLERHNEGFCFISTLVLFSDRD